MKFLDKLNDMPFGTIVKTVGGIITGAAVLGIAIANSIDDNPYDELPYYKALDYDDVIEVEPISIEDASD